MMNNIIDYSTQQSAQLASQPVTTILTRKLRIEEVIQCFACIFATVLYLVSRSQLVGICGVSVAGKIIYKTNVSI